MIHPPAVLVHGRAHAAAAVGAAVGSPGAPLQGAPVRDGGRPVTLLSAPGAALYAGPGWWRALVVAARAGRDPALVADILDCADDPAQAFAALRLGQAWLVLAPHAPGFAAAAAVAAARGGGVLAAPPPALDLAQPGAARDLAAWLDGAGTLSPAGGGSDGGAKRHPVTLSVTSPWG